MRFGECPGRAGCWGRGWGLTIASAFFNVQPKDISGTLVRSKWCMTPCKLQHKFSMHFLVVQCLLSTRSSSDDIKDVTFKTKNTIVLF